MDKKVIFINMLILIACICVLEFFLLKVYPNEDFTQRKLYNIQYNPSAYANVWMKPNQKIYKNTDPQNNRINQIYSINNRGIRGTNLNLGKEPEEIRIAIIGGSHVFDINCYDYENCPGFPTLIENELRKHFKKISVINMGIPGANSNSFLSKITLELSIYKPDIVIINSIWNDLKWITNFNTKKTLLDTPPQAINKNPMIEPMNKFDSFLGHSIIYRKIRDKYWKNKLKKHLTAGIIEGVIANKSDFSPDYNKGYEQYKINMVACIDLIKSINSIPVIALEERFVSHDNSENSKKRISYHMLNVSSHFELVSMYETCDSILYSIAKEKKIQLIDLTKSMKNDTSLFSDHVHTTKKGSHYIAKQYSEILKNLISVKGIEK